MVPWYSCRRNLGVKSAPLSAKVGPKTASSSFENTSRIHKLRPKSSPAASSALRATLAAPSDFGLANFYIFRSKSKSTGAEKLSQPSDDSKVTFLRSKHQGRQYTQQFTTLSYIPASSSSHGVRYCKYLVRVHWCCDIMWDTR